MTEFFNTENIKNNKALTIFSAFFIGGAWPPTKPPHSQSAFAAHELPKSPNGVFHPWPEMAGKSSVAGAVMVTHRSGRAPGPEPWAGTVLLNAFLKKMTGTKSSKHQILKSWFKLTLIGPIGPI